MSLPGRQWGHVKLRCPPGPLRVLGEFPQASRGLYDNPPTPMMMDLIIKIMVELLSVLALATKQIKLGRFSECAVRYTLLMLNVSQRNS
jgi:hypothetical protein